MITLQTLKRYVFLPGLMLHNKECGSNVCEFTHSEMGRRSNPIQPWNKPGQFLGCIKVHRPIGNAVSFVSTCFGYNLA